MATQSIKKVGLTGGIGSGKSTVVNIFSRIGIKTIDADKISRQITAPGTPEFNQILDCFSDHILTDSGQINRQILGDMVFTNPQKRKHLESILHPAIRREMDRQSQFSEGVYCIFEIPLLIETGQWEIMDRVLVITCPDAIRIERLKRDRNMSQERALQILSIQMNDNERVKFSDDMISNDSTLEALNKKTMDLHQYYLSLWDSI